MYLNITTLLLLYYKFNMDTFEKLQLIESRLENINSRSKELEKKVDILESHYQRLENIESRIYLIDQKINFLYTITTRLIVPLTIGIVGTMLAVIFKIIL